MSDTPPHLLVAGALLLRRAGRLPAGCRYSALLSVRRSAAQSLPRSASPPGLRRRSGGLGRDSRTGLPGGSM
jgi:hypothetical protein